jgi:hypothetical protein
MSLNDVSKVFITSGLWKSVVSLGCTELARNIPSNLTVGAPGNNVEVHVFLF